MKYKLANRRYIGNKTALLPEIFSLLEQENIHYTTVADLFAGTGVVSERFLQEGSDVIINDILCANQIFYYAWLSNLPYNESVVMQFLNYYNSDCFPVYENYFSNTFSGTYFHHKNALKIGAIREHLENHKQELRPREFYILLASLLYTTDRVANTVGHFESFLRKNPPYKEFFLKPLQIQPLNGQSRIYHQDANQLIKDIKTDLMYIDPPYNARQYVNFYHILENLAEWKCPKVFGKTLKMDRANRMSEYSKSHALSFFSSLISQAQTKTILVSYSNTYDAKSSSSNNKISEVDMERILRSKGEVIKKEVPYRFFNAGKTALKHHKEYLYLCKVFVNNM